MNGKGKYTYASGDIHDGEFKDDKINGKGKHTYASGDVYDGEYKDDKKNGKGKFTFANGDVYEGEWKDDKMNGKIKHTSLLDMAQEQHFLGEIDSARVMLKRYLDVKVKQGHSQCQSCHQFCAQDEIMAECSVCKVARYCNTAHSIEAWHNGRFCHKVMCPFLLHWRKTNEGKDNVEPSSIAILNDFFESLDVA